MTQGLEEVQEELQDVDGWLDLDELLEKKQLQQEPRVPLETLITLYMHGRSSDLYVGYYEGFKRLVYWLSPLDIPQDEDLPPLTSFVNNWEVQEISKILKCKPQLIADLFYQHYLERCNACRR